MKSLRSLVGGIALASMTLLGGEAYAQTQNTSQQNCINYLNKSGSIVYTVQGKEDLKCIKSESKGRLGNQPLQQCYSADEKGRVEKKTEKTLAYEIDNCGVSPDFGYATGLVVNEAAARGPTQLVEDIFGRFHGDAIVDGSENKDGFKCQYGVARDTLKLSGAVIKDLVREKKRGLSRGEITSGEDLEGTLSYASSKIGKKASKLHQRVESSCSGLEIEALFPGNCSSSNDTTELGNCIETLAYCNACETINPMDDLAIDCDLFDNELADSSCGELSEAPVLPLAAFSNETLASTICSPGKESFDCVEAEDTTASLSKYSGFARNAGNPTRNLKLRDLDGDGINDLVTSNNGRNQLCRGKGKGKFNTCTDIGTVDRQSWGLGIGDFNNDGKIDLLFGNYEDVVVGESTTGIPRALTTRGSQRGASLGEVPNTICFGDGAGDFSNTCVDVDLGGDYTLGLAVGHFNEDQNLDFITANPIQTSKLYAGDGTGNFTPSEITPANTFFSDALAGHFNGDSNLDVLFTANGFVNQMCLGDGTGNFSCSDVGTFARSSVGAEGGDLDSDGDLDFIVANNFDEDTVCLNDGTGNFSCSDLESTVSNQGTDVAIGDIGGDGDLDVIISNYLEANTFYEGNGDGTFKPGLNIGDEDETSVGTFIGPIDRPASDFACDLSTGVPTACTEDVIPLSFTGGKNAVCDLYVSSDAATFTFEKRFTTGNNKMSNNLTYETGNSAETFTFEATCVDEEGTQCTSNLASTTTQICEP